MNDRVVAPRCNQTPKHRRSQESRSSKAEASGNRRTSTGTRLSDNAALARKLLQASEMRGGPPAQVRKTTSTAYSYHRPTFMEGPSICTCGLGRGCVDAIDAVSDATGQRTMVVCRDGRRAYRPKVARVGRRSSVSAPNAQRHGRSP